MHISNPSDGHIYTVDGTDLGTQVSGGDESTTTTDTVIDSFEDGDISEYSGDTGVFSVTTGSTDWGSYRLESGRKQDGTDFSLITSTSGLGTYPSQGDTYSVRAYPDTSEDDPNPQIAFGVQDSDNFYLVDASAAQSDINILKKYRREF